MQLKAKYPDLQLIPTFDIELVWQSHLIRPSMYASDLERLFSMSHDQPTVDRLIGRSTSLFTFICDAVALVG